MTREEFATLPTAAMDEYMNDVKEKHPAHRERFSNQTWLLQGKTADEVLKRLRKRQDFNFCSRGKLKSGF